MALSEREYIEAARALGAGTGRILLRHLLPHLVPTIIVYATLGIATTVLLEAMLSFLGRGVQPPTPAWGMMIFESQSYFLNAPWLVFIPGAAILILALAFNLVGDGLRDALDPTQRGRTLMLAYLARRLAASLFILLGVSVVTFGLTFMIPADPVAMIAGRNSTPDMREQIRHQLGLDRPLPEQYASYLGRLVQGDLGKSYARKPMSATLIASRLPPTLLLMLAPSSPNC